MRVNRNHLIFWFFYFWYCFISDYVLDGLTSVLFELILFLTHNIYLFYGLTFCLQKFSTATRKELGKSLLIIASVLIIFILLRYADFLYVFPALIDPRYKDFDRPTMVVRTIMWLVSYLFYASAYYYFISNKMKQREILNLEQEKLQNDKDQLELENSLLRTQINPHFLYNSLNFLFAKSLTLSAELSNGIIKLSEIMRYSLQSPTVDGLVLLTDEVEHIKNVIEMARLRFDNRVYINFICCENIDNVKIIPFVLITLVENVLKHGIINELHNPAQINLNYSEEDVLVFSTFNKKRNGPKELSTGLGLSNTLKRIENAYKNNSTVKIIDETDFFAVNLLLNLSTKQP